MPIRRRYDPLAARVRVSRLLPGPRLLWPAAARTSWTTLGQDSPAASSRLPGSLRRRGRRYRDNLLPAVTAHRELASEPEVLAAPSQVTADSAPSHALNGLGRSARRRLRDQPLKPSGKGPEPMPAYSGVRRPRQD